MKLKEFGKFKSFDLDKIEGLRNFVQENWNNRYYLYDDNIDINDEENNQQRFLIFDGNKIKARNYIGFLSYGGSDITIYPKIFNDNINDENIDNYLITNLIYWLRRSEKIKFPIIDTDISMTDNNSILEILIYVFSKYTYELIYNKAYNCYEEVEEELPYLKGRLNTGKYLKENISTGKWNSFNNIHEPFLYDNKFNRIIKYVAKILVNHSKSKQSEEYLNKIIFILDEVSDMPCTAQGCSEVQLNRLQEEYKTVLVLCEMFLRNTSISKGSNKDKLDFCFLIPMEILFEEFIFNFLKNEFSNEFKEIKAQKSNLFLAEAIIDNKRSGKVFNLKQDIYIKKHNGSIIILDTKYKILNNNDGNKFGISQGDLYQMCSYAVRGGYTELFLVYPDIKTVEKGIKYIIKDPLSDREITITVMQVPFSLDYNKCMENKSVREIFDENDRELMRVISILYE